MLTAVFLNAAITTERRSDAPVDHVGFSAELLNLYASPIPKASPPLVPSVRPDGIVKLELTLGAGLELKANAVTNVSVVLGVMLPGWIPSTV